jgi:hypothetical protein
MNEELKKELDILFKNKEVVQYFNEIISAPRQGKTRTRWRVD